MKGEQPETWGEASELMQEEIERYKRIRSPEELRESYEAWLDSGEMSLEFFKSRDSDESFDPWESSQDFSASIDTPEGQAVQTAIFNALDKMDSDLVDALDEAGCL